MRAFMWLDVSCMIANPVVDHRLQCPARSTIPATCAHAYMFASFWYAENAGSPSKPSVRMSPISLPRFD